MRKYEKEDLLKMDAIEVYKMVLKGDEIKQFPNGFWQQSDAKQNAAKCTRYLIEEVLQYDEEVLKEKCSASLFNKYKLGGMVITLFNASPYETINNAYLNKYKVWEFKSVPNGYWKTKENGIKATRWLIEEKLKLNDEELKAKLSYKLFKENKLAGMISHCFNNSPYEAINNAYPNKYKEWEFKSVSKGYWNIKNGIKATKWLIEEKLKLSDEQIKEQLSAKLFANNGLGGMLYYYFDNSPYAIINYAYPNRFKKSDFKKYNKRY